MIVSILGNYLIARAIEYAQKNNSRKKYLLILGLFFNFSLLIFFKYANFIFHELSIFGVILGFSPSSFINIPLAVGISFYTFHAISYLVDIYRGTSVQKNLITFSLYISFFPQLIAGPIVRYHTIAKELIQRTVTVELFVEGIRRFIFGLAKKVLIADNLAIIADSVFSTNPSTLEMGIAWLGIICYSLQIYFDFSGYSDMAIGLAKMFGFHFPENFNYPYISQSVTEFWRRWHISLSSWFRDYLYIPLGGNRKGELRTCINLFIVFVLCGFWHGASWNFIFWGVWFGAFIVFEKIIGLRVLEKMWQPYRHVYLLIIILFGWVLFRSPDLSFAIEYMKAMLGISKSIESIPTVFELTNKIYTALFVAIIFMTPIYEYLRKLISKLLTKTPKFSLLKTTINSIYIALLMTTFLISIMKIVVQTYSPFIYFRF